MLRDHRFLGLPSHRPRVWIDLSSAASKRAGLAMHRPGRKVLQWAVKVIGWFAWLPIEKILRGPVKRFADLDGAEIVKRILNESVEYLTFYMGNDSAKSKYTVLLKMKGGDVYIAKLGKTPAAREAIRHEVEVLQALAKDVPALYGRVPRVVGDVGREGDWTWSVQTVLPKGRSEVFFNAVHRRFLRVLHDATRKGDQVLVHGDFAPWNMSIVDGSLCVYDWEDAHMGSPDEDEMWFKKQVWELLGVGEGSRELSSR